MLVACRDVKTYFNPKTARLRQFKERQKRLKEEDETEFEVQPRAPSREWLQAVRLDLVMHRTRCSINQNPMSPSYSAHFNKTLN